MNEKLNWNLIFLSLSGESRIENSSLADIGSNLKCKTVSQLAIIVLK